jgi:hypothetical protein
MLNISDQLSFEGRVEGGPSCRVLQLIGYLTSQKGEVHRRDTRATDGGGGSRLYESESRRVDNLKRGWEVTSVQVSCAQR